MFIGILIMTCSLLPSNKLFLALIDSQIKAEIYSVDSRMKNGLGRDGPLPDGGD